MDACVSRCVDSATRSSVRIHDRTVILPDFPETIATRPFVDDSTNSFESHTRSERLFADGVELFEGHLAAEDRGEHRGVCSGRQGPVRAMSRSWASRTPGGVVGTAAGEAALSVAVDAWPIRRNQAANTGAVGRFIGAPPASSKGSNTHPAPVSLRFRVAFRTAACRYPTFCGRNAACSSRSSAWSSPLWIIVRALTGRFAFLASGQLHQSATRSSEGHHQ